LKIYNVDHGELKSFDYCARLSQKENLVTTKYVKIDLGKEPIKFCYQKYVIKFH
jgi:hypothetical protein